MIKITNNIRLIRKERALSMESLAERIGTTRATIMKLENGDMQLTTTWMERLADGLRCTPIDLISTPNEKQKQGYSSQGIDEELLERCYDILEQKADELKVKFKKKELIKASITLYKIAVRDKAAGQDNISVGAALSIIENIKDNT